MAARGTLPLPNGLNDLETVQFRHVDVQKQQVERPSSARDSASRPLFASRTRWPRRPAVLQKLRVNSLSSATRMCKRGK